MSQLGRQKQHTGNDLMNKNVNLINLACDSMINFELITAIYIVIVQVDYAILNFLS